MSVVSRIVTQFKDLQRLQFHDVDGYPRAGGKAPRGMAQEGPASLSVPVEVQLTLQRPIEVSLPWTLDIQIQVIV